MGPQKFKNGQISVGYCCGKLAMGAKKTGMAPKKNLGLCFFVVTYGNKVISVGGHRISTDLRNPNCSRLSKHGTKPAFEDEMCPPRRTK